MWVGVCEVSGWGYGGELIRGVEWFGVGGRCLVRGRGGVFHPVAGLLSACSRASAPLQGLRDLVARAAAERRRFRGGKSNPGPVSI